MKKLHLLFIITLFISCNNTEDKFIGIWMGDRENFYNPNEENPENISLTQGLPILLDFKKENKLNLKIFGAKAFKNIEWKIENDSLLNINNIKYRIRKISKDTICLELYSRAENYDYKIYRIKDKKIELDSNSVIQKLTTEIWSNLKNYPKKRNQLEFENHIEYYKNSVRLLKYNVPLKEYGVENNLENVLNTYNDTWVIGKYENYYFISQHDYQMYGTSPYFNINQITKINNSELNIYRPEWKINQNGVFYKTKPNENQKSIEDELLGTWKSKNIGSKKYTYYNREIKEDEKYIDDLFFEFEAKELKIFGNETDTLICNWYLNRDKTILFYYSPWEIENITGISGESADIKYFARDSLELNLFRNHLYKNNNQLLLNINQKFEKIKNH